MNIVQSLKKKRDSEFKVLWGRKLQEVANAQHLLVMCEREETLGNEPENESTNSNTGFGLDLCDGCFDGEIGNTDDQEGATVVTGV